LEFLVFFGVFQPVLLVNDLDSVVFDLSPFSIQLASDIEFKPPFSVFQVPLVLA